MIGSFHRSTVLRKELDTWAQEGIVSEDQKAILYERYQLGLDPPWYLRSSFIISAVALIIVALGLFLIISENWHHFGMIIRVGIGIVPLLTAYGAGIYFLQKNEKSKAELALFFASLCFGANIFLQAQIFHISSYYPNGILWWALGSLPFLFIFRSSLHSIPIHILTVIWLMLHTNYDHFSVWSIVLCASLLWNEYKFPTKTTTLLSIITIGYTLAHCVHQFSWTSEDEIPLFILSYSAVLYTVFSIIGHKYQDGFAAKMKVMLLWICASVFLLLTFISRYVFLNVIPYNEIALLSVGIVLAVLLKQSKIQYILYGVIACTIPFCLRHFNYTQQPYYTYYSGMNWLEIWANCVLLFGSASAIWMGLSTKKKNVFMQGIGVMLILVFTRYMDLVGDYLTTALLFMFCGIGLLLVNSYWNKKYA